MSKSSRRGGAAAANIFIAITLFTLAAASLPGCGGEAQTVSTTVTTVLTVPQATGSRAATATAPVGESGPVMPNVDESAAGEVTATAMAAYQQQWGDGSGVYAVWGPNIVDGWALIGLENNSGLAGKDALLHLENGVWVVKDIGHGLAAQWQGKTPPGLWPTM